MFRYFMPTEILVGEHVLEQHADALILGKKAMIITGKSSGKQSGALNDVLAILKEKQIGSVVYDQIENNPSLACVHAAGKAARDARADFIIAIGGGSPLDSAKAAAVFAVNDIEPVQIFSGTYPNRPLPIAAVPTTAGTGSEVTPYSILTLHDAGTKRSFTSKEVFPKVAFLDGRYTMGLPLQIARNTAIDAMSHAIEGYLNRKSSPASDPMALEALRLIGRHLPALKNGQFTVESCTDLLWASSLAGIVISQTGTTIVHSMGYQLTYCKDVPHGMANGLLLGAFLEWCQNECAQKIQQILDALNLPNLAALQNELRILLPHPYTFEKEELAEWVNVSIQAKNIATAPKPVTAIDEFTLYCQSLL